LRETANRRIHGSYFREAMDTGRYLSKKKAARRLDVSEKTIDRLRQAGELQAIKVRGCVRITLASLLAYETRQEQAAEPTPPPPSRLPVRVLDEIRATKAQARASAAEVRGEAA
jgi:excisionase family DNA binding protein